MSEEEAAERVSAIMQRLNLVAKMRVYVREKLMSEAKMAKGSWLKSDDPNVDVLRDAMFKLDLEVGELDDALKNKLPVEEVMREAADVAICAFIAADIYAHQWKEGDQ